MMKIHPHIQKLVDTQTRNVVRLEAIRSQVFFADIKVAFKWGDTPTERPVGDYPTAAAKFYAYVAFHTEIRPPITTAYYSESANSRHHTMITNSSDNRQDV